VLSAQTQVGRGEGSDFKTLRYTTLSFAPGYSYNIILKKFFMNITLSVGPAHQWVNFKDANGKVRDEISINSTVTGRFGVGYNSDRFFAGIGVSTQSRVVRFEETRFLNSTNLVKILVGYRIQEFGVLKKRVWDVLPTL
jgi:hypothetical protein